MKGTRESHRRLRCIFLHELQLHFVLRREGALAQLVQSQLKETIAHDYPQDADEILKKVSDRT